MRGKFGFTMSEVMVTLVMLGIIGAILIPMISEAKPDRKKVMFKKAYYSAEKVINELANDSELYPDSTTVGVIGFGNTDAVTVAGTSYSGNTKFCNLFAQSVNLSSAVNCTTQTITSGSSNPGTGSFTTSDGVTWYIPLSTFADDTPITITMDVNGTSRYDAKISPNCMYPACTAPDQFQFTLRRDGRMAVSGTKEKEYLQNLTVQ